ncbi:Glycosyl hydrolase [Planctomycetales bacterium 10988]|nr:Glycosyl hydrolase [Planctomycetales bacterium 10988]
MKRMLASLLLVGCLLLGANPLQAEEGFISLFNGTDLTGWKVSEHPESVKVQDGVMICHGERAHAFYTGPVHNADFKNFELKAEFKTFPNANSGIYFHTIYQEEGWPDKGFEAQVNNSNQKEKRKTGSLYQMVDLPESPAKDFEWNEYHIIVKEKQITLKVNGETVVEFEEPTPPVAHPKRPGRVLDHGTIALQAHDPGSEVHFRNIRIKPLD